MPHFCSPSRSSTVSHSQETKTADVRFVLLTEVVKKYSWLCIFVPPIRNKTCYFTFTFQHLADAFTTVERQQKEEYKLNSKAVQLIYSHHFFKEFPNATSENETEVSEYSYTTERYWNTDLSSLSTRNERFHKICRRELVLNVENQFLDDAFDCESVHGNTSKSEYKTEYDTEYEPDSSFQLHQSICLSDDQFSEQEHLEEQLPPDNSAFVVYWSLLVLLLQCCLSCPAKVFVNSFYTGMCFSCVTCEDGHISLWRSQPRASNYYERNVVLKASTLFSANTYSKIKKYFELPCIIPFISHTSKLL